MNLYSNIYFQLKYHQKYKFDPTNDALLWPAGHLGPELISQPRSADRLLPDSNVAMTLQQLLRHIVQPLSNIYLQHLFQHISNISSNIYPHLHSNICPTPILTSNINWQRQCQCLHRNPECGPSSVSRYSTAKVPDTSLWLAQKGGAWCARATTKSTAVTTTIAHLSLLPSSTVWEHLMYSV